MDDHQSQSRSVRLTMRRRPTRQPTRTKDGSKTSDRTVITIRAFCRGRLVEIAVSDKADLPQLAEEWTYVLRSRTRWNGDVTLRSSFRDRALTALGRVGVSARRLQDMSSSTLIEVELHQWDTTDLHLNRLFEAAADIPWEYLLSAATDRKSVV